MEGDAVLSSMDSLWFYSSVFLAPSPKSKHKESERAGEPQPQQDPAESNSTTSGRPCHQAPERVKEAAAQTGRRAEWGAVRIAAARGGCGEWDERMVAWQKEQRRRALAAAAARCSQSQATMPPPGAGEGVAMKAHLRSWAHAVACSVR